MKIEQLKKELGLTNTEIAEFFGLKARAGVAYGLEQFRDESIREQHVENFYRYGEIFKNVTI